MVRWALYADRQIPTKVTQPEPLHWYKRLLCRRDWRDELHEKELRWTPLPPCLSKLLLGRHHGIQRKYAVNCKWLVLCICTNILCSEPDLPACLPKDMIRVEGEQLREYRDSLPNVISHSSCPYECHKSDFEVLSSTSGLNNAALSEYANLPIVLESLNRTALDMSLVATHKYCNMYD